MSVCNKAYLEPVNSRGIYAWNMASKLSRSSNNATIQSLIDGYDSPTVLILIPLKISQFAKLNQV